MNLIRLRSLYLPALLFTLLILVSTSTAQEGKKKSVSKRGCAGAGLCCQGKDNTCRGEGPRENKSDNTTCFCDSACIPLGDCCTDYKTHCRKVDCVLAKNWDEWGECDAKCGMGTRQRVRRVMQRPINGGEQCGPTVEKAICEGTQCKLPRAVSAEELKETGKILPVSLSHWRHSKAYSPWQDIRRNLFEKYFSNDPKAPNKQPSYCARFQLTDVLQACYNSPAHNDWTKALTKGSSICVECQPMAMQAKVGGRCRGHGIYLKETRWAAVAVPGCHGNWIMTSQREDCQCPLDGEVPSFILV